MKKSNLIYLLTTILLLSSCTSSHFYQVYEVKATNKSVTNGDNLLFEDGDLVTHESYLVATKFWEVHHQYNLQGLFCRIFYKLY